MAELEILQRRLARLLREPDLEAGIAALGNQGPLGGADSDGLHIAALLVARLRFERVLQGSLRAGRAFEEDPASFAAAFRDYHREIVPRSLLAAAEGAAFERWLAGSTGARLPGQGSR